MGANPQSRSVPGIMYVNLPSRVATVMDALCLLDFHVQVVKDPCQVNQTVIWRRKMSFSIKCFCALLLLILANASLFKYLRLLS